MKNDGKNLNSVLQERRVFVPDPQFVAQAQLKADALRRMQRDAATDIQAFWAAQARTELTWHRPFTKVLDESRAPNFEWFADGQLNVSYNCLDVHLRERGHKTALVFEGEPGDSRRLSYQELHAEVCRAGNALRALGVRSGDRVVIYMPLVPEIIIAMFACARIGAVHSVVFGGFSALSLRERIEDAGAGVLLTADGGHRAGNIVELKAAADEALAQGCPSIKKVVVLKRTGASVPMRADRDIWWHDAIEGQSPVCEPEWVGAEHPLYLLYTSGSTGRPKGIQHSSAGYLLGVKVSTRWVLDVREDDVYWCTADVGWVTGHSYVAYGPLALGATVVMYEGAPTWPNGGRWWHICQKHGVTIFYTAPTAIRALMKLGDEIPKSHDLSRLRLLGSVGEPINPEAWMWYHTVIGREHCPIVDTWWQTETGAFMIAPIPGVTATKPGSCTHALPGIEADIVNEDGEPVTEPDRGGYLVIRRPWPSMLRTIWGDNPRYLKTYWEKFQNRFYVAGDGAHRDADGYFWIMGRIDDVLKVSGHRLGTMEVESALVAHPRVAEAAVVGRPHDIKGESIFAYVVCRGQRPVGEDAATLSGELREWVGKQLGAIAKPDDIRFTEVLPKTRSGKIMRRLLRALARGEEITQDTSTLENPAILAQLRGEEASAPVPTAKKTRKPPAAGAKRKRKKPT
ncbi:MAG TPA: acetate--CoA ligase [Steroidobacteraceae bacterium]|jgi:acetyl-CoA synthetase|nr:acetate--CoA ligase [Steroidobacteraceae bacterium]